MKSHVNIMDSDIAYENVIVYHGSDHILKEPIYQGGKTDNDYGNGFYTCLLYTSAISSYSFM